MSEKGGGKTRGALEPAGGHSSLPSADHYYGTFQGVVNYQPQPPPSSNPVMGFPQPVPPPGFSGSQPHYYPHGYQTVPVYAVIDGRRFRENRLPFCGLGIGWFLFIIGFFMGGVPWYIGAVLLLCVRFDYREKPGLIACVIAALLVVLAVACGMRRANHRPW